jgi:hypothetical protein
MTGASEYQSTPSRDETRVRFQTWGARASRASIVSIWLGMLLGGPIAPAIAQDVEWMRQFGTAENDGADAIATDSWGHIYVAGHTAGVMPGQKSRGSRDLFLARYDAAGEQMWVRQFGTAADDYRAVLAADSAGRAYVAGGRLLALYDSDGNQLWLRYVEGSVTAVAVDDTGAHLGIFTATGPYLARYDAGGNQLWLRPVGERVASIALDSHSGDIYVAGHVATGNAPPSLNALDLILSRYDSSVTRLWSRTFATDYDDIATGMALDSSGHIYLTGFTASFGVDAAYLIQFDTSGRQRWIREFEYVGNFPPTLPGVATDSLGNVFVVGAGDGGALPLFFAKYDVSGTRLWAREFAGSSGRAAAIDEANNLYIAGEARPFTPDADAFVARIMEPIVEPPLAFAISDVGDVAGSGSVASADGRVTVRADGTDIWGTADAFSWTYTAMTGDFDAVVRVTSVQHVHDWTKAGLMMRQDLSTGAPHMFLFATPTAVNGVAFQRRRAPGDSTIHTSGPAVAPPAWLKLSRRGTFVYAWARASVAEPWSLIGVDASNALGATVFVGLAVTSHRHGVVAEATFENLAIAPAAVLPFADVGEVGAPGSADFDGSTFVVRGSGADIWSTSDAFGWTYTRIEGNFDAIAQVMSVDAVHEWTKAGLMIRADSSPTASHMSLFATPVHGIAFQRRLAPGGPTTHTWGSPASAPIWLKLSRRGNVVYAAYRLRSTDAWTLIDVDTGSFGYSVLVGLAVTSHVYGSIATATFEHVDIVRVRPPLFVNRAVGGNPFKLFGEWTITQP